MKIRRIQTREIQNLFILGLCLLPLAAGLAKDDDEKQSAGVSANMSLHAVRSAKLRETMNDLEKLMLERMYTQLEMDRRNRRYARNFGAMARELERTASYIPDALKQLDLSPAQQREFLKLAERLRTQASQLHRQASHAGIAELRHSLDRITATCSNCHSQFRLSPLPK